MKELETHIKRNFLDIPKAAPEPHPNKKVFVGFNYKG